MSGRENFKKTCFNKNYDSGIFIFKLYKLYLNFL